MVRYKLTLEFDGTNYVGWQRQNNGIAIQEKVEEAIHAFCQEKVTATTAGRTDAGVHARGLVCHMDLEKEETPNVICKALNFYLARDGIAVVGAEKVNDDFHARFHALSRQYMYRIINRRAALTLERNRAWHVPAPVPLDVNAMQKAATYLIGQHDFSTFRDSRCQAKSPVKTLDVLQITSNVPPAVSGVFYEQEITLTVRAKSFLHHQVRNIVGTLVEVGKGKWTPDEMKTALEKRDRTKGGPTAPACGLYFMTVEYE